jgi:hypothetical protein
MGHGLLINLIPSAEELAAIFAHAAAPAFLLAGVAGFISVLMTRLNGVVDRIRNLSEVADDDARSQLKSEIPVLKRRAVLLHRAAFLALMAGLSTTLLLMLSVGTALLHLQHLFGGVLLFGIAAAMLSLALYRFAQEVRVALHELERY